MTTLNDVLNMNDSSTVRIFKLNPEWVALKKEIKQRKDEGLSTKRLENKLAKNKENL